MTRTNQKTGIQEAQSTVRTSYVGTLLSSTVIENPH